MPCPRYPRSRETSPVAAAVVASLLAVSAVNIVWRVSVWYGLLPCSHGCYWCGRPLQYEE